jgi:hypothetical protein
VLHLCCSCSFILLIGSILYQKQCFCRVPGLFSFLRRRYPQICRPTEKRREGAPRSDRDSTDNLYIGEPLAACVGSTDTGGCGRSLQQSGRCQAPNCCAIADRKAWPSPVLATHKLTTPSPAAPSSSCELTNLGIN